MRALREQQAAQAISYLRYMKAAKFFIDAVCQPGDVLKRLFAESWERPDLIDVMNRLEKSGSLPYYVTHEVTSFGECFSILTVSPYIEDFEIAFPAYDAEKDSFRVYAYVWNVSDDSKSESGSICVKNDRGELIRIA